MMNLEWLKISIWKVCPIGIRLSDINDSHDSNEMNCLHEKILFG
jgi:hypothetical protein